MHPISLYGYCSFPPRHAVLKATIVRKSQSLLEAEGWKLVKIGDWSQSKPQSFIVETSMKVTGKIFSPYYSGFSLFKYKKVLTNMNNK